MATRGYWQGVIAQRITAPCTSLSYTRFSARDCLAPRSNVMFAEVVGIGLERI